MMLYQNEMEMTLQSHTNSVPERSLRHRRSVQRHGASLYGCSLSTSEPMQSGDHPYTHPTGQWSIGMAHDALLLRAVFNVECDLPLVDGRFLRVFTATDIFASRSIASRWTHGFVLRCSAG
jgi:hypothetical protein